MLDPARYGTKVHNPTHRWPGHRYAECNWCKKLYTPLGVSRHWPKCPVKQQFKAEEEEGA